jgi:hypothetical protein
MPFSFRFLGEGVDGWPAMVVIDGWCDLIMK